MSLWTESAGARAVLAVLEIILHRNPSILDEARAKNAEYQGDSPKSPILNGGGCNKTRGSPYVAGHRGGRQDLRRKSFDHSDFVCSMLMEDLFRGSQALP